MTVSVPPPVAAVAALAKLAALPLPLPGGNTHGTPRQPDQIVLSPPPSMRTLWQMALAGQQQLATLLPTLDRLLQTDPAPLPLGHLARSLGDAAHWVDAGAAVMSGEPDPARPSPETFDAWRQTTHAALNDTSALLARAEQRLDATPPLATNPNPETLWALTQIGGAQHQVGLALGSFAHLPKPQRVAPPARRRTANLNGAVSLIGIALSLLFYLIANGAWLALAGLAGTIVSAAVAFAWGWRVVVTSRSLRLDVRR